MMSLDLPLWHTVPVFQYSHTSSFIRHVNCSWLPAHDFLSKSSEQIFRQWLCSNVGQLIWSVNWFDGEFARWHCTPKMMHSTIYVFRSWSHLWYGCHCFSSSLSSKIVHLILEYWLFPAPSVLSLWSWDHQPKYFACCFRPTIVGVIVLHCHSARVAELLKRNLPLHSFLRR